jgi:hypothetical protein
MTILNIENDGYYPELIVMTRVVHQSKGKGIDFSSLCNICSPPSDQSTPGEEIRDKKLRCTLNRWRDLGLFVEQDKIIKLNYDIFGSNGFSADELVDRLPFYCRKLVFKETNALPLMSSEADSGLSADFVRGIAWLLAQDIYSFPTHWPDEVESLHNSQIKTNVKIIQNDTRWSGLRHWARYLGFATGDGTSFKTDPTSAIRDELPFIFNSQMDLSAKDFLQKLSQCLPVLDSGKYRKEVENHLDDINWRRTKELHLSMSLSFALQRLHISKTIALEGRADAGSSFRLTANDYQPWTGFEHVRLLEDER